MDVGRHGFDLKAIAITHQDVELGNLDLLIIDAQGMGEQGPWSL